MKSISRTTGNHLLESSLSSVVSIDLSSSWAARSWQEAFYAKANGDTGKARFQQKQLQEKEQKLLRMFESQQQKTIERVGRGSAGSSSSSTSSSSTFGAGKVRQLFDERRGGTVNTTYKSGWDRSYPLEPLARPTANTKANGHTKAARGTSLDRTFAVLTTTSYKTSTGKVPVRRSKSQARRDDDDDEIANNNPEVAEPHRNGYNNYQSFKTLPPEEVHVPKERDDNSNQLFRSEIDHVEELLSKQTLLDNEEPPVMDLMEEDDEPDTHQMAFKEEDEPDRSQFISKLPNVGGPLRAPDEAHGKPDRDRYKTYNASNSHLGQEKRRLRTEPELKRPRDLEVKKSKEVVKQAQETRKTRDTSRHQLDTTRSPSKTQVKSVTPSRAHKTSSGHSSPQARTPASPTASLPTASGAKKRTPTGVGRSGDLATSRATPPRAGAPGRQPSTSASAVKDDLVECRICSRRFATDRVQQHEQICSRTSKKTRKVFDPVKHRVQGTEAEAYIRKIKAQPQKAANTKKADWRKKHEDFIATIRAAKQAQAHIAAGGKVSDLPPPPPSDYSDYVQCPHCSRRFNDQAAARHIPKCATMLHNKPKTVARGAPPRRR